MKRFWEVERTSDTGVTLVELLVVTVIMGVVSILITSAVIVTSRNSRFNEDEATGLTDVRKVVERLGRDVRQARGVDQGATASRLVLWVDYNSDYRRDPEEIVAWSLVPSMSPGHWDVIRTVGGTTTYKQATTLIDELAFDYATDFDQSGKLKPLQLPLSESDAARVRVITTNVEYDAYLDQGAGQRTVQFASRLRNVQ